MLAQQIGMSRSTGRNPSDKEVVRYTLAALLERAKRLPGDSTYKALIPDGRYVIDASSIKGSSLVLRPCTLMERSLCTFTSGKSSMTGPVGEAVLDAMGCTLGQAISLGFKSDGVRFTFHLPTPVKPVAASKADAVTAEQAASVKAVMEMVADAKADAIAKPAAQNHKAASNASK